MSFFPPPADIPTEVFARLPEALRRHGEAPAWGAANHPGKELHSFLEGPSFDRAGNLYVVDIPYGRVFRVSPSGDFATVAEYDGWPNGLKIHKDGRLFVADYKRGIVAIDPNSGAVTDVVAHRLSESFKGVNDLVFDDAGNL
jgi:gluconolactonase